MALINYTDEQKSLLAALAEALSEEQAAEAPKAKPAKAPKAKATKAAKPEPAKTEAPKAEAETEAAPKGLVACAKDLSQALLSFFKSEGYNTRKIGVMAKGKNKVQIRVKDHAITLEYVKQVLTQFWVADSGIQIVLFYADEQ